MQNSNFFIHKDFPDFAKIVRNWKDEAEIV